MNDQLTENDQPMNPGFSMDPGAASVRQPGDNGGPAGTHLYDFGDAQRLSPSQIRQLEQVHERFARELSTSLSALTRRSIKSGAVTCKHAEPQDARDQRNKSGLVIVLDVHPLDLRVELSLDSRLVFALLELLLGGGGSETPDFERELTEIELSVLQDLHGILIRELDKAWRPAARFTFQVIEQQADPKSRQSTLPAGGSLASTIELEVQNSSGRMTMLYPVRVGREIQSLDAPTAATDSARRPEATQQALFERLQAATMSIDGTLQGATVRLRDLADLRTGDLLCLDLPVEQPIDIAINGVSRFSGRLTAVGRKKGIRIQEIYPKKGGQPWAS